MDFFLLDKLFGEQFAQVKEFSEDGLLELGHVGLAIGMVLDLIL